MQNPQVILPAVEQTFPVQTQYQPYIQTSDNLDKLHKPEEILMLQQRELNEPPKQGYYQNINPSVDPHKDIQSTQQINQSQFNNYTQIPVQYQNQPQSQIQIPSNLLSNPEAIIKLKIDNYFEKIYNLKNFEALRNNLILDEQPNFLNPLVPNYGNNNINYNPYYTNDPYKLIINMNGYLFNRFHKINIDEDLKFFSHSEKRLYYKSNIFQVLIYSLSIYTTYRFLRYGTIKFGIVAVFNLVLLPFPLMLRKLSFYNSYLRNFNGYTDEQIDYILTVNTKAYQLRQKSSLQNNLLPVQEPPKESKINI